MTRSEHAEQQLSLIEGAADSPRPWADWAPERVLQAAVAGQLRESARGNRPVNLAGRPVTACESRAITELVASELLSWEKRRIEATEAGRRQLERWAKYRPCVRSPRDGGEQA